MTISVVIPSYGQAQYLEQAIQSVLSQTHQADEVIVVDDGSTDGSLEIAQRYEPRVKVIRQKNKGLASARNTGIMNVTGEYVFFLDADDIMLPNCLERISREVAQNLGISEDQANEGWGQWGRTYLYDVIVPSICCFDDKNNEYNTILMENLTFDDFKVGNRLAYCAAIRRSVLLEVGGYSPKMDVLGGWEDLHLWYTLMEKGKAFKTIQEPLVKYRLKENSMWKEAEKNKEALWAQIVKDFPQAKDHVKI